MDQRRRTRVRACGCGKTWLTVVVGLGEVHVGGERGIILRGKRGVGEGGGGGVGGVVAREEVEDGEGGCHGGGWCGEVSESRNGGAGRKEGI